ncbi:MAG: response regulator [Acidobacteriota bacterium]
MAPKQVLIVDDEPLFRDSVAEELGQRIERLRPLTAADGQEATQHLASEPIDLVITDLRMPRMDGFDLLSHMVSQGSMVPIIVLTAYGTPEIKQRVFELGGLHYLEKPIDLDELCDLVQQLITDRTHLQGITLQGFVQLLQMEQKTGSLRVQCDDRIGTLVFIDGRLIDARHGRMVGEHAALEILAWQETALEMLPHIEDATPRIDISLSELLLEAARLQDERALPAGIEDALDDAFDASIHVEADPDAAPTTANPADETSSSDPASSDMPLSDTLPTSHNTEDVPMADVKEALETAMDIDGAIGVALVDFESGLALGSLGGGSKLNIEVAAAGNTEVVRAKMKVMRDLGLGGSGIEDMLITLADQYHLIRPLQKSPKLFLYLATERGKSNLAMARHRLGDIEQKLEV